MATSLISPLQDTPYFQQRHKRKFNYGFEQPNEAKRIKLSCLEQQPKRKMISIEDCGFGESEKGVKFRYNSQPLLSDLSNFDNEKQLVVEKPAAKRSLVFRFKKLCLVLDLDHTLLHTMSIREISREEQEYLNSRASPPTENLLGDNLYRLGSKYTKLRPYTREFLQRASAMFELFICTMGGRKYAREMEKLLDPEGVLFKKNVNVASKEDCTFTRTKNLDVLAGPNKRNTIIIDDTEDVWPNNKANLIPIQKYNYFTDEKQGCKLNRDDGEEDEALISMLEVLQDVHSKFFELYPVPQSSVQLREYAKSVDVTPILDSRKRVTSL
ncbi:hypothetical protein MKW94_025134 [Papaver nudicaule]|uniref:RNA polymerase II C-terminal domain phosphatase-like n=1 Tax=Papaver nudicaule TaxID=74823 RepID=A0AA41VEA0_PAPNU|nr:hypothetical protein [Papaver nudicaule]